MASPSSPVCHARDWTKCCVSTPARSASPRRWSADHIGCVLLDDNGTLEAGEIVHGTGEVVRTSVGTALLGRVVDPLGRPLDEGALVAIDRHDPVERPAPAILDRALRHRAGADRHPGRSIRCFRSAAASAS